MLHRTVEAARFLYLIGDRRKAIWMMDKAANMGGMSPEDLAWQPCATRRYVPARGGDPTRATDRGSGAQIVAGQLRPSVGAWGKIQQAEGDLKSAIDSYEAAAAVTPKHDTLVALGDLYAATGDPQKVGSPV